MDKTEDCATCGRTFRYDIALVPRQYFRGTDALQPLCETCLHVVNNKRENCGIAPIPAASGAYLPIIDDNMPTDEDDFL